MIIKSKYRLQLASTDQTHHAPVLSLMTGVLFPGSSLSLQISRPENLALLNENTDGLPLIASYAHAEVETANQLPLHQVGVLARITDTKAGPGHSRIATVEGISRVALRSLTSTTPFLKAQYQHIEEPTTIPKTIAAKIDEVINKVSEITHLDPIYSPELSRVLQLNIGTPGLLADRVASSFHFSLAAKQELLEAVALDVRFDRLLHFLKAEQGRIATVLNINENVKQRIQEDQQRHYLRQQLSEIKRQLGEDLSEEKEASRLRQQVAANSLLPVEVASRAKMEIDRLSQLSSASLEFGVTKNYIDWMLNLPWGKTTATPRPIAEAEKILASDYFGPASLREQVLQRLASKQFIGRSEEGPTLCLIGAPGTGKASLARAIAKSLGKEFLRVSIGGMSDVADIKGSARTSLGAYPGLIVRLLRDCGTVDPVVLIEDLDYFNIDNDSSVNMALLDVIDTRRNGQFLDQYLGVPIDLSNIFFICSVRSFEEIPEQFIPRLEILELPGYIEKEKIHIAKRFIIPGLLKRHGLSRAEVRLPDKTLSKIITSYTQEAGLLIFAQQIEKICRKVALEKASGKKAAWILSEKSLSSYLGTQPFVPERAEKAPEIGIVAGLAWTGSGGELMLIEGLKMPGDGQIITTGSLGEVMRESIHAANSYVRSKADTLGIDPNDFKEFDIHIHFPSGAIPKDGPSAGIAVSLVIASVMSERPIRTDIAMTGEVTLRGRVLPVGGVKEKISAAYRVGIFQIILPKENEKDLKELPRELLRRCTFHFIDRVDDLFELCLLDFKPSSHSLEKLLRDEISRIRKKKPSARKSKPVGRAARSRR